MVSKPAEPVITEPSQDHPTKVACPSRSEKNLNGSDKFFPGGRMLGRTRIGPARVAETLQNRTGQKRIVSLAT